MSYTYKTELSLTKLCLLLELHNSITDLTYELLLSNCNEYIDELRPTHSAATFKCPIKIEDVPYLNNFDVNISQYGWRTW